MPCNLGHYSFIYSVAVIKVRWKSLCKLREDNDMNSIIHNSYLLLSPVAQPSFRLFKQSIPTNCIVLLVSITSSTHLSFYAAYLTNFSLSYRKKG